MWHPTVFLTPPLFHWEIWQWVLGKDALCVIYTSMCAGASPYESEADVRLGRMYDSSTYVWSHLTGKLWPINCTSKIPSLQFWRSNETNTFFHPSSLREAGSHKWAQNRIVCWTSVLPLVYFMRQILWDKWRWDTLFQRLLFVKHEHSLCKCFASLLGVKHLKSSEEWIFRSRPKCFIVIVCSGALMMATFK